MSFRGNHQKVSHPFAVELRFMGYRERFAVLTSELTGEILWPLEAFPRDLKSGDMIQLELKTIHDKENEFVEAQRKLLEELIN